MGDPAGFDSRACDQGNKTMNTQDHFDYQIANNHVAKGATPRVTLSTNGPSRWLDNWRYSPSSDVWANVRAYARQHGYAGAARADGRFKAYYFKAGKLTQRTWKECQPVHANGCYPMANPVDSIDVGTLIACSYDGGKRYGKPLPVAEIAYRGTSIKGQRYVGVRLAQTDSLRDGKVWGWTSFGIDEGDLGAHVKICGKLDNPNPEFLLGRRAA
jgi:hypothetical protein